MSRLKFLSRFDADVATQNQIHKLIDDGLNSTDWFVRHTAAKHPNLTREHLDKALNDSDRDVRLAVVKNPDTTKYHISIALNDPDELVRYAARMHNYS